MFCFSKYFLHRFFFFLSFLFNCCCFFTALERSLVGYWAISQHGPSGLRHSATFPNFDGLINGSSNDIGMRSMEVWNWEQKISNNLLITVFPRKLFFFKLLKPRKSHIVSALSFLVCNENLNSFLTRVSKLFKAGNYSREETIRRNTVLCTIAFLNFPEGL